MPVSLSMRKCREKRGEAGKEKGRQNRPREKGRGRGLPAAALWAKPKENGEAVPLPRPADYRKNFRRRLSFKGGEMAIISRVSPRMKNTARG